jgi:hypothetical protein
VTRPDLTDDDVLVSVLRDSLDEVDPVPDAAITFAKSVARLSDLDAELATLVADSLVDDVVLFRHDLTMEQSGDAADRLVTFATPQLSVDIDLQAGRATVVGVITPPISVEVDLETTKGTLTTTSDELGRFQIEAGGSLCRLRIHAHDGAVITPWITR